MTWRQKSWRSDVALGFTKRAGGSNELDAATKVPEPGIAKVHTE